jgi:hypothetical protein
MSTQVWFRNPKNYVREIVEIGHPNVVWDAGYLYKHSIDPFVFCKLYFGSNYEMMIVGDSGSGCAHYRPGGDVEHPVAVYPVWSGESNDLSVLEKLVREPVGENPALTNNVKTPRRNRPVLGQSHVVVVTDIPGLNSSSGKKLAREISELQEENPYCIIHIHGIYSYNYMFGMEYASVDVDGRNDAALGWLSLPNGKRIRHTQAPQYAQWFKLLGFFPVDMQIPRNRCIYNMKSALWAARYFKSEERFRIIAQSDIGLPDIESPDTAVSLPVTKHYSSRTPKLGSDKLLCDSCSIATSCKLYRSEAVCIVPGSTSSQLARLFGTRRSEDIVHGLSKLLERQADRLEAAMRTEESVRDDLADEGKIAGLDPEVSKLMNSLFNNGVKLAKLVDPRLAGGTKVGVFVNGGQAAVMSSSPQQLTAAVVAELEAKGVPRESITPEMIAHLLTNDAQQAQLPAAGELCLKCGEDIDVGDHMNCS